MRPDRQWHGGRILVVEDNWLMAEVTCEFLKECGLHPVGPVTSVEEARRVVAHDRLDGAILDLKLGSTLCFSVCLALDAKAIPYNFLTGYADLSVIPAERRGVPVIFKPFATTELQDALSDMLRLGNALPISRDSRPVEH